jgi:hypothetical protein
MANLQKLKRRNTLGAPPTPEEASANLAAPEIAPVPTQSPSMTRSPETAQAVHGQRIEERRVEEGRVEEGRIDGRTLRRTGRTVQLALRVKPSFDHRLRQAAARDRLLLCEVLERALDTYELAR